MPVLLVVHKNFQLLRHINIYIYICVLCIYIYIYVLFISPVGGKGNRFHYWQYIYIYLFIFFPGSLSKWKIVLEEGGKQRKATGNCFLGFIWFRQPAGDEFAGRNQGGT